MAKNNAFVFLIGADDPEMKGIERVLEKYDYQVCYAMKEGRRVNPGNAYQADTFDDSLAGNVKLVLVGIVAWHILHGQTAGVGRNRTVGVAGFFGAKLG